MGLWSALALALSLALSSLAACGGDDARGRLPEASIGRNVKSEQAWRPLMRRWVLGTDEERAALDDQLETFAQRHPGDPLARLALVLRGFNALAKGDLDRAKQLVEGKGEGDLASPLHGRAGTTRDLAQLLLGAVERRQGQHVEALEHLEPLLHKMLDQFATAMLDEELAHAALGARRWLDAVRYLEVWQREAEPGHEREVASRIKTLLTQVPRRELMAALDERAADGRIESDRETAQLIAQQLAIVVVTNRDGALARTLLERYGALLGGYGEAVARLAVDTRRGRVRGSTVGLLLALRTDALRRRSADVVSGVAFGLGLPGSDARLVTREAGDDKGGVASAMAELASEGAAVIVAGVDPQHNAQVAAFARDESLPVLLLTPDASGVAASSPFVFLVGNQADDTLGLLARTLRDAGADAVASIGAPIAPKRPSSVDLEVSCNPPPSAPELRAKGIDALALTDGAYCGAAFMDLVNTMRPRLALGLGVAVLNDLPDSTRRLAAGVFPVDEAKPDARLKGWLDARRGVPSWWAALGRDAAVLALAAVQNLTESTTDLGEVKARRVEATSALAAAKAELWTSDARGFGGGQRIARKVVVEGGP